MVSGKLVLRKEKHAYAVFPLLSNLYAQRLCYLFEKFMGDLKHDSNSVSCLSFRILTCTVLQILYDMESLLHRFVSLHALYVGNRSNAAVIMLKAGII